MTLLPYDAVYMECLLRLYIAGCRCSEPCAVFVAVELSMN